MNGEMQIKALNDARCITIENCAVEFHLAYRSRLFRALWMISR